MSATALADRAASVPEARAPVHLKHRADIDGLRSFAVVPVVLFHAGLGLRGGFVGVDIFFVISGYLISLILFRSCANGSYSILGFYDRRIRRIFPALFAMALVTTIAALFILLPSELLGYGRSLLYAVLFASNLYFWSTTSYFGDPNIDIPLLHTWSLAVEEQFYIFWPFAVLVLAKLPRRWTLGLIVAGAILSLLLSQWLTIKSPTTAFYLLPSRAWELLIGALLAQLPAPPERYARWLAVAGAVGLAMIVYAVLLFNDSMLFPGFAALLPCVGTALLLYAGPAGGPASRLLSWRPLVAIGLISYSLYLWHWPVLSLAQLALGRALSSGEAWAAVALSVVLAALSWRFVEQPFRHPAGVQRTIRLRSIGTGLATMAVFGVVAGGLVAAKGLPQRLPPLARAYDRVSTARPAPLPGCELVGNTLPAHVESLCFRPTTPEPSAVLWGDSHALHFNEALAQHLSRRGIALRSITTHGCAPFAGATQLDQVGDPNSVCAAFNARVLAAILADPDIHQVYISGRWGKFLGLAHAGAESGFLRLAADQPLDSRTSEHAFTVSIDTTLAKLRRRGIAVTLIGPNPEFDASVPKCMARQTWRAHGTAVCETNLGERPEITAANALLRTIAAANAARYVDVIAPFCHGATCSAAAGPTLYYRDSHHLSPAGAALALGN